MTRKDAVKIGLAVALVVANEFARRWAQRELARRFADAPY